MINFGPTVAQNFGSLFRMHIFFFKKHKSKKHEAQKAETLRNI